MLIIERKYKHKKEGRKTFDIWLYEVGILARNSKVFCWIGLVVKAITSLFGVEMKKNGTWPTSLYKTNERER